MKINFDKQITIPLDYDGDEGFYNDSYEIELDDYWVLFDLSFSVVFKSFYGGYLEESTMEEVSRDVAISNLRVIDENSNDIEFDYKDLERQIIKSVDY
jgi:hypothetical protein